MEGWLKLHRKFLEWEWFYIDEMVKLFIFLLLSANYEDKKWQGIEIKKGQFITGRKSLSESTKISEQTIRTCLERLKLTNEITIESTSKYSIITICKYNDYQIIKNATNQQTNQQLTSDQPATNQQLTTTKERKKEKEYKEVNKYDFVSLEFKPIFERWLKYKSDRKEKYKSIESEKVFYEKLVKYSNNNPVIANEIIENSICNNWAGIFELKNKEFKKINDYEV